MNTFQTGRTYSSPRYFDGYDSTEAMTIVSRTAKTVRTSEGKMLRVSWYNGAECVAPRGRYTGAPFFFADRDLTDEQATFTGHVVRY